MDDKLDLARQIFAQITMVFEDTDAVEGQSPHADRTQLIETARSVRNDAKRVDALSLAVLALLDTTRE